MKTRSMCLPAAVCSLFLALAAGAKDGRKPDAWITTKVKSTLAAHRNVSAFGTKVETKNGKVILRGDVDTIAEKELVEQYTREIEGVRDVDNQLVVREYRDADMEDGEHDARGVGDKALDMVGDAALTSRVKAALAGRRGTSGIRTHVDTERGVVTLSGRAKSAAERDLAEKVVREVKGVRSINNDIEVR